MATSGGPEIEQLIQLMARLPGLGPRSARRAVLQLIKKKETLMVPLSAALDRAVDAVRTCDVCGNIDTRSPCGICSDPRRGEGGILIVVEDVSDLWALERAGVGMVKYHVLGGVLSPLDGVGPEDLSIDSLVKRAPEFSEIVLAVNATVEGQTTAHYITDRLAGMGVKVTRLAHGVPVGGELDYLDEGTLSQALKARTVI
ncbi:recombination mediator RecR [Paradevosia shaoguanensis]|uniref:Recombination protein RecR n=1 Tax=Paradevosia shaoguanensis TaxID=1335043 RepID=A0AA41QIP3_9HYPH|nr:recombination mediator RecR [Paradevosia shaoguanensis]KFL25635.1 recombinase RecR [Devosia sp. 17-2-E-8]MCF1741143.1 recombination mediator RecR [Paradevosia shaoguanensis]MCI0125626.1 recombination mediator RecR [Paradevosia shaoguanensis]